MIYDGIYFFVSEIGSPFERGLSGGIKDNQLCKFDFT